MPPVIASAPSADLHGAYLDHLARSGRGNIAYWRAARVFFRRWPNPQRWAHQPLAVLHVRYGKAMRGSPPRRRAVATVMPWAAETLAQYLQEVRPHYGCDRHPAVWLTERGGRISTRQIDVRFAQFRRLAARSFRA